MDKPYRVAEDWDIPRCNIPHIPSPNLPDERRSSPFPYPMELRTAIYDSFNIKFILMKAEILP